MFFGLVWEPGFTALKLRNVVKLAFDIRVETVSETGADWKLCGFVGGCFVRIQGKHRD